MDKKQIAKEIIEWGYCVLIAIILAIVVRYFFGTPTIVKQPSMYPTLKQNERLILNRWYRTTKQTPTRGEIITFEAPSTIFVAEKDANIEKPIAEYDYEPKGIFSNFVYNVLEIGKTSYIKRVIGLPGEHVKIEDGKVYINGEELKEDYLQEGVITTSLEGAYTDVTVPEDTIFVLGDNRIKSTDSRRFGCVPLERIESKVFIRFWPLDVFGRVD